MGKSQSVGTRASAIFKAMADIASDDPARYNLARVQVEHKDGFVVITATNGHILVQIEVTRADLMAEIIEGMPARKAYVLPDDASKHASVQAPYVWEIDVGYPDVNQVIPKPRSDQGGTPVGLAAGYLVTIGRCAERLAKAGGDKTGVMLRMETQNDPWGPVRWTARLGDIRFLAVQMPMRM